MYRETGFGLGSPQQLGEGGVKNLDIHDDERGRINELLDDAGNIDFFGIRDACKGMQVSDIYTEACKRLLAETDTVKNEQVLEFLSDLSDLDLDKNSLSGHVDREEVLSEYLLSVFELSRELEDNAEKLFRNKKLNTGQVELSAFSRAKNLIQQSSTNENLAEVRELLTQDLLNKKKALLELNVIAKELNAVYRKIEKIAGFANVIIDPYVQGLYENTISEREHLYTINDYYRHNQHVDWVFSKLEKYDTSSIQRIIESLRKRSEEKKELVPLVKEFERILPLQGALERKIEALVYGQESAQLPNDMLSDVAEVANETKPEVPFSGRQIYFPVGVSKDLPQWGAVWRGEKMAAKPIDIYADLLWLNNQGQAADLVICDTVQVHNFMDLYGLTEEVAREKAIRIGDAEEEMYKNIIEKLGLKNISVRRYDEVKAGTKFREDEADKTASKREHAEAGMNKFQYYKNLCERLTEHEVWKDAFAQMVEPGAVDKGPGFGYAIDELAFILATRGVKVSHEKEARYDILAVAIMHAEKLAEAAGLDLYLFPEIMTSPVVEESGERKDKDKMVRIVNSTVEDVRNRLTVTKAGITKLRGEGANVEYFVGAGRALKNIKPAKVKKGEKMIPKIDGDDKDLKEKLKDCRKVDFPFVVPSVGAQSFGWRSAGQKGAESTLKFLEPYSTHFFGDKTEMFLDSTQVVAVPDGKIGGKIMTLEANKQIEYARKVLRPLLVHFFKSLETAPAEYFMNVGKTKTDLSAELSEARTLVDVLNFIQKYISTPAPAGLS